jgi:predicted Zn finger-like uncharacterized protein
MRVPCPGCQTNLNLPDGAAGKRVRCPKCQHVFRVPEADPAAAPVEAIVEAADPVPAKPSWPTPPRRRPEEEEGEDRPRRRRRDEDDEEDRPARRDRERGGNTGLIIGLVAGGGVLLVVAVVLVVIWLASRRSPGPSAPAPAGAGGAAGPAAPAAPPAEVVKARARLDRFLADAKVAGAQVQWLDDPVLAKVFPGSTFFSVQAPAQVPPPFKARNVVAIPAQGDPVRLSDGNDLPGLFRSALPAPVRGDAAARDAARAWVALAGHLLGLRLSAPEQTVQVGPFGAGWQASTSAVAVSGNSRTTVTIRLVYDGAGRLTSHSAGTSSQTFR